MRILRWIGWSSGATAGLLGLLACGEEAPSAAAGDGEARVKQLKNALQQDVPGARVAARGGVTRAFGAPLATGQTPAQAVANFVAARAQALGTAANNLEPVEVRGARRVVNSAARPLGLMPDPITGRYKFYLYRYGQVQNGVRVYDSELLALVQNRGSNPVVWASSSVRPLGSFTATAPLQTPAPDRAKMSAALQNLTDFKGRVIGSGARISSVSAPELLVFAGAGAHAATPRMALDYTVETQSPPGKWRMITAADTGDVLHVESLVVFEDIGGSVSGHVTTGVTAMDCADEVEVVFPEAEVSIVGGSTATTDPTGQFLLANPGTEAVDVTSAIGGTHFDVTNHAGSNEILTQSIVPPGPASFVHNAANASDEHRAQVNGYIHAMQVRDYLLQYVPDYPTISTQLNFPVNVNRADLYCPGNAWYDYSSINFCVGSASYANTSFASVNHHEFGHHIVTSGGSGQGAYGEGMSDVVAALIAGDPGLGYGFYLGQCTTPLRTADNDCQYSASSCSSCGSESHACGNLLSGAIWSVREQLAQTEPEAYEELLSSLVLSSIPMHTGTTIDASIAIDLLTLDDDDGLLDNGTPHYSEICAGFAAHGMQCPPILTGMAISPETAAKAEGPGGGPFTPEAFTYQITNIGPDASIDFAVTEVEDAAWLSIIGGSGQLALDEQALVQLVIDQQQAALLPNGTYDTTLQFTNLTNGQGDATRTVELRVGIPQPIFAVDFESGLGGFTIDAGSTNLWHLSTGCASAQAGHSMPTSLYFGSDASCNFAVGAVTGSVTSPTVAVNDTSLLLLRLNYFLHTEQNPSFDRASVALSVNGGAFTTVASNFGTGTALVDGSGAWQTAEMDVSGLVDGLTSAEVRARLSFNSGDSIANSDEGFHVDDVELRAFSEACTADSDCDDGLSCTGNEVCMNGACIPGTPVSCDDGIACTVDSCDELASCMHQPDHSACADTNVCNGNETCDLLNGCVAGTPLDCDDGNACTIDACDPVLGCSSTPVSCDDGNACTIDACDPQTGCISTVLDCDDGNECTADSCDLVAGCQNAPVSGSCSDDGDACTDDICESGLCTHPENQSCGPVAFLESNGSVVMEAESFHAYLPRADHTWDLFSDGNASGGQLLVASPNVNSLINTGFVTGSPELQYDVDFSTTGTYYVWVRGSGQSGDDDSCHVGIDGTGPTTSDRISSFPTSFGWSRSTMDGPVATLNVAAPGVHTISVWMREDGFRFDKLVLTTDESFVPSGIGPAESPESNGPPEACTSSDDCDDANSCTLDDCNAGACEYTPMSDGTACDDDANVCTDDVCSSGLCSHLPNTGPCSDDGNSCTNDICSGGLCSHPDNGSCQNMGPCAAFCTDPVSFSGNYQSGNLGTAATCHESAGLLNGGVCGNFANGRTLSVNGQQVTCNSGNWPTLPAPINGGYCITTTAGDHAWAYFATW